MEILDFNVSFQHIWLNVAFASSVPSDAPAMEVGEKHNLSNPRCVYAGFLWVLFPDHCRPFRSFRS